MTIIFYDIPSKVGPWSPNTWKARYCLNLKKIPYKTEWIEYPDIETRCKALGIPPTEVGSKGKMQYTLPAIHDPSTGAYISDSPVIAEYLERQYPDGPKIFPHNTLGLQIDFERQSDKKLDALWVFVIPPVIDILNPESHDYFRSTREKAFGKPLEDVVPTGDDGEVEWGKVLVGFGELAAWYKKTSGPFIMGDEPSWADFVVGGHLIWINKSWGDANPKWKTIIGLDGGVWKGLLDALTKYSTIN